jgi:hypothetical protein
MMQLTYRNDLEGGGCNKVSIGDRPSGRGVAHEIFSFFEDFSFLMNLGHLMIMLDIESYWMEELGTEEPTLGIISFIKRYILGMNRIPITPKQILLFANEFPELGTAIW